MPWSTSNRGSRLPSNWQTLRRQILRRDSYSCQHRDHEHGPICGRAAREVDHIIAGDDHSPRNLRAICTWHHARKSSAEGNAARPRHSRWLAPEAHPGSLVPPS